MQDASGADTPPLMHWMLDLLHSCVALGARLTASNVRALPEGDLEEFTAEWLKCSVLRGGLEEGAYAALLASPSGATLTTGLESEEAHATTTAGWAARKAEARCVVQLYVDMLSGHRAALPNLMSTVFPAPPPHQLWHQQCP